MTTEAPAAGTGTEEPKAIVNPVVDRVAFESALTSAPQMLLPKTLEEAITLANVMAKSQIVPKDYWNKPQDVLIAGLLCSAVGVAWPVGIKNIAVINGRPTMWGDLVKALVDRSGVLEEFYERPPDEALEKGAGLCRLKRRGQPAIERRFSIEDAKRAGLDKKAGPWQQYPGRMLQMRARSWALRDECADVLNGINIREEAEDFAYEVVGETPDGRSIIRPRRLSARDALPAGEPDVVSEFLKGPQPAPAAAKQEQGSQLAAAAPPEPVTVNAKIEGVEEKKYDKKEDGKPTGEKVPYWIVQVAGGTRYFCFDEFVADTASCAMKTGETVALKYRQGNKGPIVTEIAPVSSSGPADPEVSP